MTRTKGLVAASLAIAACAFGFRGLAEFDGDHALGGIDAVRLDLPDTPIVVVATADADSLAYEGEWRSVGGTSKDAERNALEPQIIFERSGAFAELRAYVPLDVHDLVDLQIREVRMPSDRDLEILTGTGDIDVTGVVGAVTIDIDVGEVDLLAGPGPIAVRTGNGDVSVDADGIVDVHVGHGDIHVVQQQNPRDAFLRTGSGNVRLELASDANLDLHINADGNIRVRTNTITTVTHGSFARQVGNGQTQVEIRTGFGSVEVCAADFCQPD